MLYYNNAAKDVKIKQFYDVILFEVLSYESSITQFLDIFLDFDRKKKSNIFLRSSHSMECWSIQYSKSTFKFESFKKSEKLSQSRFFPS